MGKQVNYKKYRIFLNSGTGQFVVAASNTVNDLVNLTKAWLSQTTPGMYLPANATGYLILQELDENTGVYKGGSPKIFFESKKDIITKLRELGGR